MCEILNKYKEVSWRMNMGGNTKNYTMINVDVEEECEQ